MNEMFQGFPAAPASIPILHFRTKNLPDAAAFAEWRERMAPLFHIEQARYSSMPPRGELTVFLLGAFNVHRCTFNGQHLWRDPPLIATSPDHLVLQYYRSGGFRGTIAGQPVCIVRGQVCVCDLSQEVDAYAATSDTIGLGVPRSLLGDIDPAALRGQLDAPRNRLLGGYMASLPKRLTQISQAEIPVLTRELVAMLTRVFGPDDLGDDVGTASLEEEALARSLKLIEVRLAAPQLSPADIAAGAGISRATLYRLFAPMGGIMRYVQERRLLAVRDALNDPLDSRKLSDLAAAHGFRGQDALSRAFRVEFGLTPRDWRRKQLDRDGTETPTTHEVAHAVWENLGSLRQR